MSSYLAFEGTFDPRRNFAITNWSEEDITVNWKESPKTERLENGDIIVLDSGDNFYTVHAGEVKTFPQYIAYYLTQHLVDREMYKIANKSTPDTKERERLEMAVGNKDLRKPFEDKTIQEVVAGQESPEVTAMRAKIRQELIDSGELGVMSSKISLQKDGTEFPDVPKKNKGGRLSKASKTASEAAAGI